MKNFWRIVSFSFVVVSIATNSWSLVKNDLISLGIEDLMNIEIETASKKSQKITDIPAAAFVMTADDIKRTGATNIIDVLRLVPGVSVARIDANKWAITSRGFNGRFSNKLLVMIDGRTVYSPIFSGVFWDMQDIIIEDIEKVEIVRGPGSTLWGANAVNGVINIITKKSSKTLGTRIDTGAGNEEKVYASASYGGRINEGTTYRLSGKFSDKDGGSSNSHNIDDSWDSSRGGLRLDMEKNGIKAFLITEASSLNLSESQISGGSSYLSLASTIGDSQNQMPGGQKSDSSVYGQYALAKIKKNLGLNSDISLQAYFDRTVRNNIFTKLEQKTTDVDLQYRLPTMVKNDIITGCGARFTNDSYHTGTTSYGLYPQEDSYTLLNFFLQDEIEVIDDLLKITAGTKIEKNDFSGYEFQPSAKAMLNIDRATSVWTSVSRAVRTPSRGEETGSVRLPSPAPGYPDISLKSNPNAMSEKLMAWELGLRHALSQSQFIDASVFFNDYYDLRTLEMSGLFEFMMQNKMKGHTKGAEIFYEIDVLPTWRLTAGYSYLIMDLKKIGSDPFKMASVTEDADPRHKIELRSSSDITDNIRLDLWLRFVDEIRSYAIPEYTALDATIGWKITPTMEISLTGRDLLDESHPEYPGEILQTMPTELERSFFAKFTWKN